MRREFMADRMVNYADAMAAFAVVNSLAFLVALTEQEVRCSLVSRTSLVYLGVVVQGVLLCTAVVACHRAESRLRLKIEPIPADLQSLRKLILCVRIGITLLATVGVIPFITLALDDSACVSVLID